MLTYPDIDPIAVRIGPLAVRWYGLMYLAAFVMFLVLGRHRARQQILKGWKPADLDDLLLYGMLGVVLGGRLGYCLFYKPGYYFANPLEILAVWQGGMSFHGGLLGGGLLRGGLLRGGLLGGLLRGGVFRCDAALVLLRRPLGSVTAPGVGPRIEPTGIVGAHFAPPHL